MKKTIIILVFLGLLLTSCSPAISPMILATATAGSVYYVSTGGNDTYNGSSIFPWKTIQKAANTMSAGDTVNVLAGDYTASGVVLITKSGTAGSPITFQGNGAIVKGFNFGWDGKYNYINIRGFDITSNYVSTNYSNAGIFLSGAYNLIENNNLYKVGDGIWAYGYYPAATSKTHDNIIRNNKISQSVGIGMQIWGYNNLVEGNEVSGMMECIPPTGVDCSSGGGDAVHFWGQGHTFRNNTIKISSYGGLGVNPEIEDFVDDPHLDCFQTWFTADYAEPGRNILFEGNYCDNLQYQSPAESGQGWMIEGDANNITIRNNVVRAHRGVNTHGGTTPGLVHHLYIYNNTFINNLAVGAEEWSGINLYEAPYTIAKNNIFYDQKHTTFDISGSTTGQVIDYNLIYNSDGSLPSYLPYAQLHELRGVNPMFVDAAAKDYRLQPNSPACTGGENGTYMGAFPCVVLITPALTNTFTPTPTYTKTPTASPTPTKTAIIPTLTPTASNTPIAPTLTSTATKAPTFTPTKTPTNRPSPTITPTQKPTPTYNKCDRNRDGKVTFWEWIFCGW
jgi:hypothetical protein